MSDYDYLPCSNDPHAKCATCALHNNGCPVEMPYNVVKAVCPVVKTTPKAGIDVQELVKAKYPTLFESFGLSDFDWKNDLDGILDFLYGERQLGLLSALLGISNVNVTEIINLIESNCEVHNA